MQTEPSRRPELGQKWVCFACSAKFYDLNKEAPLCPRCAADQRESPALRAPRRARSRAPEPKSPPRVEPTRPRPDPGIRLADDDDLAPDLDGDLDDDLDLDFDDSGDGDEVDEAVEL